MPDHEKVIRQSLTLRLRFREKASPREAKISPTVLRGGRFQAYRYLGVSNTKEKH